MLGDPSGQRKPGRDLAIGKGPHEAVRLFDRLRRLARFEQALDPRPRVCRRRRLFCRIAGRRRRHTDRGGRSLRARVRRRSDRMRIAPRPSRAGSIGRAPWARWVARRRARRRSRRIGSTPRRFRKASRALAATPPGFRALRQIPEYAPDRRGPSARDRQPRRPAATAGPSARERRRSRLGAAGGLPAPPVCAEVGSPRRRRKRRRRDRERRPASAARHGIGNRGSRSTRKARAFCASARAPGVRSESPRSPRQRSRAEAASDAASPEARSGADTQNSARFQGASGAQSCSSNVLAPGCEIRLPRDEQAAKEGRQRPRRGRLIGSALRRRTDSGVRLNQSLADPSTRSQPAASRSSG